MAKTKGANGTSPGKTNGDSCHEDSPSSGGGGGCMQSLFLLTLGFWAGVLLCVGAAAVIVYPDTSSQAIDLLRNAGVSADHLQHLRRLQLDLCPAGPDSVASSANCPASPKCPECAKCPAAPKCPECAKCPAAPKCPECEKCPACNCPADKTAQVAECNQKVTQLQKQHQDSVDELTKSKAAWATERRNLESNHERSVADAVAKATAAAPVSSPTQWTAYQAVISVLDSAALRACDAGDQGPECPDLHAAMRTWDFGIKQLRTAMADSPDQGMGPYLDQIALDAEGFLNVDHNAASAKDMFITAAYNNRQVFQALRPYVSGQAGEAANPNDATLPRPVRGLLCNHNTCDA